MTLPPAIPSTGDPGLVLAIIPAVAILAALVWLIGTMIWQVANGGRQDPNGYTQPQDLAVATMRRVWILAAIGIIALLALAAIVHAIARVIY